MESHCERETAREVGGAERDVVGDVVVIVSLLCGDACSAVRWRSGRRPARWLLALTGALEVGLGLATELAARSMEGSFLQV